MLRKTNYIVIAALLASSVQGVSLLKKDAPKDSTLVHMKDDKSNADATKTMLLGDMTEDAPALA